MEIKDFAVLGREDIKPEYKDNPIKVIIESDTVPFIPMSARKLYKFNVVLFVDNNGDIFVIKNRYGRNSKEYLEYLLKKVEIFSNRTINAETFIKNLSKRGWWRPFYVRRKCNKFIRNVVNMYGGYIQ